MAVDLALYVLADPLHAVLVLASTSGSGFDDGYHVDEVHFRFRGDGPSKDARLERAAERDRQIRPMLDEMHRRAVATLTGIPDDVMVRDSNVPVSRLPGNKLKAMGLAERALLQTEATDESDLSAILADRYMGRAFVVDVAAYDFLLRYADQVGTDTAPLRRVLEAGFGRVATILGE
jgi:hypothetical protein